MADSSLLVQGFRALSDRVFPYLEALDQRLHCHWYHPRPLCRLVGAMERGYYERGTDWAHPVWEKPTGEWAPESRRLANRMLLDAVAAVWDEVPDQRFGQFVMNLSRTDGGFADTWEWSHKRWREALEEAEIWGRNDAR